MAYSIPTAFVKTYEANIQLLIQQLESKFRDKCYVKPLSGQKHYVDFIGTIAPQVRASSAAPTVHQFIDHSRRRIIAVTKDMSTLVDRNDILRMGTDPTNDYLRAFRAGYERDIDTALMAAAIGSSIAVTTEDETETGVTLASAGTQQIVESGTVGMTAAKARAALKIFNLNDVDPDEEKFLALSPYAIDDLLNEPDLSVADQAALNIIRTGKIADLYGFRVYMTNRLPTATANIRPQIAWVKNGLCMGIQADVQSRITEESQFNFAIQLWMSMDYGCTRLQEKQVVEIQTYEA